MSCEINKRKRGNTKRFNGVLYNYLMTCTVRREAEERKKVAKKMGTLVRILKVKDGYDIYGAWG